MADENRGSIAQSMRRNFESGSRFKVWAMLTLLSMIVIITICDDIPRDVFEWEERWALAVAGINMSLGFIMALFSFFKWCDGVINNGFPEFCAALICCALWVAGTGTIMRPESGIATNYTTDGTEIITNPNIYFATWFALIASVYLTTFFFVDIKSQDRTVVSWMFMFTISAIIIGVSSNLLDRICNVVDDNTRCNRTYYTIAFSVASFIVSTVALFLYAFWKLTPCLELCFSLPIACFYIVGVILVTSASGPGASLGSLYFFTWAGAAFSCLVVFQAIQGMRKGKGAEDREAVQQDDDEES